MVETKVLGFNVKQDALLLLLYGGFVITISLLALLGLGAINQPGVLTKFLFF